MQFRVNPAVHLTKLDVYDALLSPPRFRPLFLSHILYRWVNQITAYYSNLVVVVFVSTGGPLDETRVDTSGSPEFGLTLSFGFQPLHDIDSLQSFIVGDNHPFIALLHLQSLPYCNTIARLLRNIPPPHRLLRVCHTSYNIAEIALVIESELPVPLEG